MAIKPNMGTVITTLDIYECLSVTHNRISVVWGTGRQKVDPHWKTDELSINFLMGRRKVYRFAISNGKSMYLPSDLRPPSPL